MAYGFRGESDKVDVDKALSRAEKSQWQEYTQEMGWGRGRGMGEGEREQEVDLKEPNLSDVLPRF